MNEKYTAVEWLFIQLYEKFEMKGDGKEMNEIFEQAKQIEKQQIITAWIATDNELQRLAAEEYYYEKYVKNKQ
jgi:hypothetical protein